MKLTICAFVAIYLFLFIGICASYSSFAEITINIDPESGVDTNGCGVNTTACWSVWGALSYNNVTQNQNVTYALQLQDGIYSGTNNTDIIVPSNVVEIYSASMNASKTVFLGQVSNMTTFSMVFQIQSSINISNISFAGNFTYRHPDSNDLEQASCLASNISSSGNSTPPSISLSGVTVRGDTQLIYLVNFGLPSGASLFVNDLNVDWFLPNDKYSYPALINVWSTEVQSTICSLKYVSWPQVSVTSVSVQNVISTDFLDGAVPSLLFAKDVTISVFNVTWTSSTTTLVWAKSSCNRGNTYLNPSFTEVIPLAPISIENLTASNFICYSDLFSLVGGRITFTDIDISNVIRQSYQQGSLINLFPTSFQFDNSHIRHSGEVIYPGQTQSDNSIVEVIWNIASRTQLTEYSSTPSVLKNVIFAANQLRPVSLSFVTSYTLNPTTPFQTAGITVEIDSCQFIGNDGTLYTNSFGGAVQASATFEHSYAISSYNVSVYNLLLIRNSVFEGNTANINAGALSLLSVSANITNSTFSSNRVETFNTVFNNYQLCNINEVAYFGGGAIYTAGYSTVSLNENVTFTENQVIPGPPPSFFGGVYSTAVGMSGAILCCSLPIYTDITIASDGSTSFVNNTAPVIKDITCSNSSFHEKLSICHFEASPNELEYCEYGVSKFPVWLYSLIAVVLLAIVLGVGWVIYRRRQRRSQYEPLLGENEKKVPSS
eukprot:TRINITY_DN345_c0_g1_i1.p1 TRINITY_DN345_c0_g1~~TRINITY_DN345_c0_g1_i1.p1  ORF type:complete len:717 (-),score=100.68 TRINITY_DN345_c0_g1_i1:44-2194(-)